MVDAIDPWISSADYVAKKSTTKIATPDIIINEESLSIDSMAEYVFDLIGGQELLSSTRSAVIDSPLAYQQSIVKDSGQLFARDATVPFDTTSKATFKLFEIDLDSHIPEGYVSDEIVYVEDNILHIEQAKLRSNYFIDLRFVYGENTSNGIIYEGGEI